MIAIYLYPDRTQVLRAKLKKNRFVIDNGIYIEKSYLEYVKLCDVNQIIEMFNEVKDQLGVKNEDVYIVLPDFLFRIDCYNFVDQERLISDFEKNAKMSVENLNISIPIDFQSSTRHKKTACLIEKDIVNVIFEAAKVANLTLISIEPASMAYLRTTRGLDEEKYIFFIYENIASITAFSPIAGFYSYTLNKDVTISAIKQSLEQVNIAFNETLIKSDNINTGTFQISNTNAISIYIVADSIVEYQKLEALQSRLKKNFDLPIETDLEGTESNEWLIPVGTLLQALNDKSNLYLGCPESMHITIANVLPESARKKSRFEQLRKSLKKFSRIAIVASIIGLIVECGTILYFSSIQIPNQLQKDYDQAQKDLVKIENELKIVELSKKEQQYPLEALTAVIGAKPSGIGFTSIEIGEKPNSGRDKTWINLIAKTQDTMSLQDFSAKLAEDPIFSQVTINQITSDSENLKSAKMTISKGKVGS